MRVLDHSTAAKEYLIYYSFTNKLPKEKKAVNDYKIVRNH